MSREQEEGPAALLLASSSPRRKELLALTGHPFSVCSVETPEWINPDEEIESNLIGIATEKARAAVARHHAEARGRLVLGADTVVTLGERILGKPRDRDEAIGMLRLLQGRTHRVYTAFAILEGPEEHGVASGGKREPAAGRAIAEAVATEVTILPMEDQAITRYVDTMRPYDKAGSYGIQDPLMACHVGQINGCWYNVMGLPVSRVCRAIDRLVEERLR